MEAPIRAAEEAAPQVEILPSGRQRPLCLHQPVELFTGTGTPDECRHVGGPPKLHGTQRTDPFGASALRDRMEVSEAKPKHPKPNSTQSPRELSKHKRMCVYIYTHM